MEQAPQMNSVGTEFHIQYRSHSVLWSHLYVYSLMRRYGFFGWYCWVKFILIDFMNRILDFQEITSWLVIKYHRYMFLGKVVAIFPRYVTAKHTVHYSICCTLYCTVYSFGSLPASKPTIIWLNPCWYCLIVTTWL